MAGVDVIVPCYQYGALLPECVDSVLSQQGVDVRVLVIDDASPDGSADVARELAAGDPRVEVRIHAGNRGHLATYNEGLEWAEADYTVLLSADDLLTPGALRRATQLMDNHPQVGFTYGHSVQFSPDAPRPEVRISGHRAKVWPGEGWIARRCRSGTNVISSPEVVVRTRVQRQAGGYRADLPYSGDLEMWLRLAARGDVGVVLGADQALYRVHGSSMTKTTFGSALADLQQRHAAFETFFRTSGDLLREPDLLRAGAARAIARRALWRASRERRHSDPDLRQGAPALAEFALRIDPGAHRTAEFRAWHWADRPGRVPLWTAVPTAATGARSRLELWWYWRQRKWRCV